MKFQLNLKEKNNLILFDMSLDKNHQAVKKKNSRILLVN